LVEFRFGIRRPELDVYELENILGRLHEQFPERFDSTSSKLPIATDYYGNKIYLCLTIAGKLASNLSVAADFRHDETSQRPGMAASFPVRPSLQLNVNVVRGLGR
jgi:hypothetical protein